MKQHITVEQLNELTVEQKKKLQTWWNENYKEEMTEIYEMQDGYDPILSIGQMIEFLDEQNPLGKGFGTVKGTNGLTEYWVVTQYDKSYKADELCDALWEAVKEVLK